MLVVLFHAASAAYALPCKRVHEVVPHVPLRPAARSPATPAALLGHTTWRGKPLPVIDLSLLLGGATSSARLSTRILVADAPHPERGRAPLGLVAEQVTDVESIDERSLASPGLAIPDAPYLGPVFPFGPARALHQLVELDVLVPAEIRRLLECE